MNLATVTREQALAEARRAVDRARAQRDALPIRTAAEQAARGSSRSADEIELTLRRLHRTAGTAKQRPTSSAPAARAA